MLRREINGQFIDLGITSTRLWLYLFLIFRKQVCNYKFEIQQKREEGEE